VDSARAAAAGAAAFGPGGAKPNRPYHAYYGWTEREPAGQARAQQPRIRRHLQIDRRRRIVDAASTASTRAPCTSVSCAVDPSDAKYVYVLGVHTVSVLGRRARTFKGDAGKGVSPPTAMPCGSTRATAPAHADRLRRRFLRQPTTAPTTGTITTTWPLGQFLPRLPSASKRPYWGLWRLAGQWHLGRPQPLACTAASAPSNEDLAEHLRGRRLSVAPSIPPTPTSSTTKMQDGGMGPPPSQDRRGKPRFGPKGAGQRGGKGHGQGTRTAPQASLQLEHALHSVAPQIPRSSIAAADFVFKSLDRGNDLKIISPELTLTKARHRDRARRVCQRTRTSLWAGTDDGALWVGRATAARTGPMSWTRSVCRGRPLGRHDRGRRARVEGRAYVAFDAHRADDDSPYLFVTEDFGQNLEEHRRQSPRPSARRAACARDVENPDLLYCGNRVQRVRVAQSRRVVDAPSTNNLPTVAVHEIAVHPTAG